MSAPRPSAPARRRPPGSRKSSKSKTRKPDYGLIIAGVIGCIVGTIVLFYVARSMPAKARSGIVAGLPNSVPIVTSPRRTIDGTGDVHAVVFQADGKGVLVGDRAGLTEYDPATGAAVTRAFPLSGKGVRAAALSPSGKTLAVALAYTKTVRIVHAANDSVDPSSLTDAAGEVEHLTFSPDGRLLLGGGVPKKLFVWDAESLIEEEPGRVFDTTAAAKSRKRLVRAIPLEGSVRGVAFSPDGRLAAVSVGRKVLLLDTGTWLVVRALAEPKMEFGGVAFSPDGKNLAAAVRDSDATPAVAWEVTTGKVAYRAERLTAGGGRFGIPPTSTAEQVAYSPNGDHLAVARADGMVALTEAKSGKARRLLQAGDRAILSVGFSPDSRTVVTGSADGSVKLWDL